MISSFVRIHGCKATVTLVDENIHLLFDRIVCYLKILEPILEKFSFVLHVSL